MALQTLAKIKEWLSITGTEQDGILSDIQAAVDQAIANYCETDFTDQTIVGEMLDCRRSDMVVPLNFPILSVQSLKLWINANGTGGLEVDPDYMVVRPEGVYLKTQFTPQGRGLGLISYHYGYAVVPDRVKMASTLAVEAFYRRRARKSLGLTSRSKEGEAQSYENYKGAWDELTGLPVDVVSMLGEYRDISIPVSPMAMRNQ